MGYHRWFDHVTKQRLLRQGLFIACTVPQRQLRLYRHVARCQEVHPAYEETTWGGGGQGDVHRAHGLGKLMNPAAGMYLGWEGRKEGGLHVDYPLEEQPQGVATQDW